MWPRCTTAWARPSGRAGRRSPISTWRSGGTASWTPFSARRTGESACRYGKGAAAQRQQHAFAAVLHAKTGIEVVPHQFGGPQPPVIAHLAQTETHCRLPLCAWLTRQSRRASRNRRAFAAFQAGLRKSRHPTTDGVLVAIQPPNLLFEDGAYARSGHWIVVNRYAFRWVISHELHNSATPSQRLSII